MKTIFTMLFLLTTIIGVAANKTKSWDDGPLTWNDFKGITVIEGVPSFLKTELGIESKQETEKGKVIFKVEATAHVDCDRSFADASQRSDQRLRYHQMQFDLLELYRRRLQNDLNGGMTGIDADNRLKHYQAQYQARIDEITINSDNGKKDPKVQEAEYYVRKHLEDTNLPAVREVVSGNWSYGFLFGTGATFNLSNIDTAFSYAWTFTAGLGVGYKRLKLGADISYAQPKILNLNILNVPLQSTNVTYATYLGVSLTLGYSVINTQRLTVTPKFGGFWSSYGWNAGNYAEVDGKLVLKDVQRVDIDNFNWYAGIDFDFHFYTLVGKTPFFLTGNREQYISSIRVTPFVGRAIYKKASPQLSGCQVGFTIAYVGMSRSLGFK